MIYRSLRDGRFITILIDMQTNKEATIDFSGFANIYFPTILEKEDLEFINASSQTSD
jgi:hypothetical protein